MMKVHDTPNKHTQSGQTNRYARGLSADAWRVKADDVSRIIGRTFLIIFAVLVSHGCTDDRERGFKSSQPELMEELEIKIKEKINPQAKVED